MASHRISASQLIHAPAKRVYAIIADYEQGHPRILPKPPFVSLAVEQGGIGEGTVIYVQMRVLGQTRPFRAVITEPDPGRVLVETNDNGYVTTFTVEPRADGQQAYVTISTDTTVRAGFLGSIQKRALTRLLQPVYVQELAQLASVASTPTLEHRLATTR